MDEHRVQTMIIGAGPAGLTAAYQLVKRGLPVTVVEADDVVGGISRTVEREGWRFDIGGHRFFTKVASVEALWHEILPDEDFLSRPRLSRIHYKGALFDYPLKPINALRGLGLIEAVRCTASYCRAKLRPPPDQTHFEGWVTARFGARLYRIFFKTYTEKVWGVPADQIQADWAAQRIKNLSLGSAIWNALRPQHGQTEITTLIDRFQYPKLGPGLMWERTLDLVRAGGAKVALRTELRTVHHAGGRAVAVSVRRGAGSAALAADGAASAGAIAAALASEVQRQDVDHVISSMPLSALVFSMDPPAPAEVQAAAAALAYRDFLTVALVVPQEFSFPDNWIYVHSPEVRVGRVQNFGSWSPFLVKEGHTCLGLEYFVNEGDDLWTTQDADLVALAGRELAELGLVPVGAVERGYVVRMPKAYPVYDVGYRENVQVIRDWLAQAVPNVHPVGRNGMHKYNNQDHSMLTAMLTVENIVDGTHHDVWTVNVDADYHEATSAEALGTTGREAPILPVRPRQPSHALA